MEKRNLTCIGCPMGCALLVEMNGKEIISSQEIPVKKGAEYAVKEVTDPTRIVTNDRSCEEWKYAGGVSKDSTGYSERKDF